jgi:hypothetical protein
VRVWVRATALVPVALTVTVYVPAGVALAFVGVVVFVALPLPAQAVTAVVARTSRNRGSRVLLMRGYRRRVERRRRMPGTQNEAARMVPVRAERDDCAATPVMMKRVVVGAVVGKVMAAAEQVEFAGRPVQENWKVPL